MLRQPPATGRQCQGVVAALLLASAFLLAPGQLRAACGNHVRFPGDIVRPDQPPPPLPPARPCQGPSCSEAPTHPPLAPPTLPPAPTHHDPALALADVPQTDGSWRFLSLPGPSRAIHRVYPPDRPPRGGF